MPRITTLRRGNRPERLTAALDGLAEQARDQVALAEVIENALQPDLREGFAGSDLDPAGTLTVYAAAPEWAALMHFEAAGIEKAANEAGWPVKRVRIRLAL